jgi:formylglycine-generating enzyme required for sulfatase activity
MLSASSSRAPVSGALASLGLLLVAAACGGERPQSTPTASGPWQQAIAAIAASDGKTASTLYAHFALTEQKDLVPIGMDPESKLWEFVHLPSGTKDKEIPRRDPSTGRLVPDCDMGIVFVLLPGGTSWIGTQKEDPAKPNYDPQGDGDETLHQVNLTPYFLSKYEMTQFQWLRLTGRNPSISTEDNNLALPVEGVIWSDCEELMRLWSLSLPTEAQWEVGCRGGTTTPWWTGSDENDLKAKENVGSGNLAVVGSKRPNPFGLFDTHGNLWEWCLEQGWSDQSPREGDGFRSGGSPSDRSYRGGAFGYGPLYARAGERSANYASYRFINLGLRPARASRL